MWVFVGSGITVYRIAPGRGYEEAEAVLGAAFSGVLERDGWHSYRRFTAATHQTCLAHLLRRTHDMLEDARGGQVHVPRALQGILTDALALRDARDAGGADPGAVAEGLAELEARVDALLDGGVNYPPNVKLLNHVQNERQHLFTFLLMEGVQATNWRSEQALRPQCVVRKHWGGNATWDGAHTQEVLTSVLRTSAQQGIDPIGVLVALLRSPSPGVAPELCIPGRAPPSGRDSATVTASPASGPPVPRGRHGLRALPLTAARDTWPHGYQTGNRDNGALGGRLATRGVPSRRWRGDSAVCT